MKPLVYKVFTTPGMARSAHSRKRVTLNVVLSDIGEITQGETDQLVALFDEAQQAALANDILAKRAQAAEEEARGLKTQVRDEFDKREALDCQVAELSAQVNRLREAISYSGAHKDCQELADLLEETSAKSLAEHDAQVYESLGKQLLKAVPGCGQRYGSFGLQVIQAAEGIFEGLAEDLQVRADRIRREAHGGPDGA